MSNKPFYLKNDLDQDPQFKSLSSSIQDKLLKLRENGYLIIDLGLDESFLDSIIEDCSDKYEDGTRISHAYNFSDNVKSLALNADIIDFLKIAFGREPIPFQTLNFSRGTEQLTHSDTIHFNCFPYGFMCGVWVALEKVDEENGPLHYYPGSHKLPFFGLDQFSLHGSEDSLQENKYEQYERELGQLIKSLGLKKESVNLEKGQCLIWAANLLHGGDPILDNTRTRNSQVTHYYFENCFYFTPLLSSLFKNDLFARQPYHIGKGKRIDIDKLKQYALDAGVDLTQFQKSKKKKSLVRRVFG